jgi:hypothetical protein
VNLEPLDVGLIGIYLLVIGAAVIVVEGILAAVWSLRIAQHSQTLNERLSSERASLQADLERLRATMAETEALWEPYRRLFRWVQHPLAIALLQSFVRRWATAR